jgi:hypothetical protein
MKTRRIDVTRYFGRAIDSPERLQEVLRQAAAAHFKGDMDRVELWVRGANPRLGGRRPQDLGTSPLSLAEAVAVLL